MHFFAGRFGESTLASHGVLMQLVALTFMVGYWFFISVN
jgi:Na+-driven multidrug efflux pump